MSESLIVLIITLIALIHRKTFKSESLALTLRVQVGVPVDWLINLGILDRLVGDALIKVLPAVRRGRSASPHHFLFASAHHLQLTLRERVLEGVCMPLQGLSGLRNGLLMGSHLCCLLQHGLHLIALIDLLQIDERGALWLHEGLLQLELLLLEIVLEVKGLRSDDFSSCELLCHHLLVRVPWSHGALGDSPTERCKLLGLVEGGPLLKLHHLLCGGQG